MYYIFGARPLYNVNLRSYGQRSEALLIKFTNIYIVFVHKAPFSRLRALWTSSTLRASGGRPEYSKRNAQANRVRIGLLPAF